MTAAPDRSTLPRSEFPFWRRLVVLVAAILALTGCQLDVRADVVVQPDGTGRVLVTATADAELVEKVPTLADDLVLDDFVDAGWIVDGPNATSEGGLTVTLAHDFEGDDEATNLLRSLGPPFNEPRIDRRQDGDTATNSLRANLGLGNGFATFADDDLVAAVGAVPFSEQLEAEGADPATDLVAELVVTLPGDIDDAETNGESVDDSGDGATADGETLRWVIPTDGSVVEASARSEQAPSEGSAWARPLSIVALVALIAWVSFMTLFIGYVTLARRRRSRRYRRRALP